MALRKTKKERFEVPGTIVKCQSGRYLAFYEHRSDIIANGDSEIEAKKNLKKMYRIIKKNEENESEKKPISLPPRTKTKSFTEKLHSI
jgi:predicted RNase H-like HicB family nuclease